MYHLGSLNLFFKANYIYRRKQSSCLGMSFDEKGEGLSTGLQWSCRQHPWNTADPGCLCLFMSNAKSCSIHSSHGLAMWTHHSRTSLYLHLLAGTTKAIGFARVHMHFCISPQGTGEQTCHSTQKTNEEENCIFKTQPLWQKLAFGYWGENLNSVINTLNDNGVQECCLKWVSVNVFLQGDQSSVRNLLGSAWPQD